MSDAPVVPAAGPGSRPASLVDGVLAGDPRSLARAISIVEDGLPAADALLARLHPHGGRALVVGVTGAPGAGKSTLVDRLASAWRREQRTVGIIAVDPSSPFSGGAVLGDRVRMGAQSGDRGVFIRSMATRGHLGGLARATADAVLVLDASGRDLVIVETVGVGQDEVDVVRTADVSIVVLVPGTGDEVQAQKAGIMEIADLFVINKADREGADRLVQAVRGALSISSALQPHTPGAWVPPVLTTVASDGTGVAELREAIDAFAAGGEGAASLRPARRRAREDARLRDLLVQRFLRAFEAAVPPDVYARVLDDLLAHRVDPVTAASTLLARTWKEPLS